MNHFAKYITNIRNLPISEPVKSIREEFYEFPNGYGASVRAYLLPIYWRKLNDTDDSYNITLYRKNQYGQWQITTDVRITDDFIEDASEEERDEVLEKIFNLPYPLVTLENLKKYFKITTNAMGGGAKYYKVEAIFNDDVFLCHEYDNIPRRPYFGEYQCTYLSFRSILQPYLVQFDDYESMEADRQKFLSK